MKKLKLSRIEPFTLEPQFTCSLRIPNLLHYLDVRSLSYTSCCSQYTHEEISQAEWLWRSKGGTMQQIVLKSALQTLERNAKAEGYTSVFSYMIDCISKTQDIKHTIDTFQARNPYQSLWKQILLCEANQSIGRSKVNVRKWKHMIWWSRKDPFFTKRLQNDTDQKMDCVVTRDFDQRSSQRPPKRHCFVDCTILAY